MSRSCQASAYGQWLQVKTTTVAGASAGASAVGVPAVSGRVKSGTGSPGSSVTAAYARASAGASPAGTAR